MQPWWVSAVGARPFSVQFKAKASRLRIVHGVTKEPELARELAAKHGFRLSTDLKDAIADPEVQAILLATPHSLHVEQVRMVAAAGKPVWCEKPLALTRAEAERAVAAVEAAGVPLGTGNNKRCFASMRELKRVVDSGEIGKVFHIEGHFSNEHSTRVSGGWRDDPGESPGAGMTGAGLHVLDAFINLVGPISYVDARCISKKAPPDPRDVVAALVEFESGATGLMATVRAAPVYLALRRVRHRRHGRSARRGYADRRQDRRADGRAEIGARRFAARAFGSLRRRHRGQGAVSGAAGSDAEPDRRLRGGDHLAREG